MKNQPKFIKTNLTKSDIEAINQGGCDSGAYMPAVNYYEALETMSKYGDVVFEYIEERLGEMPSPEEVNSWEGLATFYLSIAVELYAQEEMND